MRLRVSVRRVNGMCTQPHLGAKIETPKNFAHEENTHSLRLTESFRSVRHTDELEQVKKKTMVK